MSNRCGDCAPCHVDNHACFDRQRHRFIDEVRFPRAIDDNLPVHRAFSWHDEGLACGEVRQHSRPVAYPIIIKFPFTPIDFKGHVRALFGFDIEDPTPAQMRLQISNSSFDLSEISGHTASTKHFIGHPRHGGYPRTILERLTHSSGVGEGVTCGGNNDLLLTHEVRNRGSEVLLRGAVLLA